MTHEIETDDSEIVDVWGELPDADTIAEHEASSLVAQWLDDGGGGVPMDDGDAPDPTEADVVWTPSDPTGVARHGEGAEQEDR